MPTAPYIQLAEKLKNTFGLTEVTQAVAAIIDRDGTINEPHPPVPGTDNTGYVLESEKLVLLPHVGEGLALMQNHMPQGLHVFTQQKCVGKGLINLEQLAAIHDYMQTELLAPFGVQIGQIEVCPHAKKGECDCMKPSPKMLYNILEQQGLKPHQVIVIGDSDRDMPSKELMEQGMMFVAVPNPEAASGREGKLGKADWEAMTDPLGRPIVCATDLLELGQALEDIHQL